MVISQEKALKIIKSLYTYIDLSIICEDCSDDPHWIYMLQTDGIFFSCPKCKRTITVMAEFNLNRSTHWSPGCKKCTELEKEEIHPMDTKR